MEGLPALCARLGKGLFQGWLGLTGILHQRPFGQLIAMDENWVEGALNVLPPIPYSLRPTPWRDKEDMEGMVMKGR